MTFRLRLSHDRELRPVSTRREPLSAARLSSFPAAVPIVPLWISTSGQSTANRAIGVVLMRFNGILTGAAALGLAVVASGSTALAATLRVSATGASCSTARYTSIQNAIDAARPNDKIIVCPGVYDEQLVLDKRLTIRAKGGAILRPSGMISNTTSLRTGDPQAAAVVVAQRVKRKGLEGDASHNGPGGGRRVP